MNGGIMYEQKEIVLILFPYTDLTGNKLRPALIISNSNLNNSEDRLCVLVTTNKSSDSLKINEEDQLENKLPFESFIKPHRIFTINKKLIVKSLCIISNSFHERIIKEINKIIN